MENDAAIARSERFTLSLQPQGYCSALRFVHDAGGECGEITWAIANVLRIRLQAIVAGNPVTAELPEVSEDATTSDLYVLAEVMNATLSSFLTHNEEKDLVDRSARIFATISKAREVLARASI